VTVHELKCEEPHFSDIEAGRKRFEVRFDDRDYQVGDLLHLRSLADPDAGRLRIKVIHILRGGRFGAFGVMPGYVVMSIELMEAHDGSHDGIPDA
jgi:ASC-1-like (ASCH) protein